MKFLNEIDGASKIKQDSSNRFITDTERNAWNNKVDKISGKGLSANDYTTTEKNKLAGIESGATKDMSASEILNAIKVVDGSGSGLDADLLDGKHASYFVPVRDSNLAYEDSFIVYGDSNKYYPVIIGGGNQDVLRAIKIWRRYSELAPPDWYSSTHKGSLNLYWMGNFGSWGGAVYKEFIYDNSSQYTVLLADCYKVNHSMAYCFMLRGGGDTGAIYHIASDQPIRGHKNSSAVVDIFYNGPNELSYDSATDSQDCPAPAPVTTVNTTRLKNISIAKISDIPTNFNNLYYTESEMDTKLSNKADKSQVLTNVPANAKFTDTITTINGKTGAIAKADIVALGIPSTDTNTTYSEVTTAEIDAGTASTLRTITGRRISYILDKANTMISTAISGLTKSSIGLGSVDNIKQASKTEFDGHNSDTTKHTTSAEKSNWNSKETTSGAQTKANTAESNAKSYVDGKVLTDVPANAKFTDTTYPNATTSVRGVVQLSSSTSSTSASLAATSSAVKAAYDLANGKANSSHTHTIANVTNLQTTLNDKASSTHIHSLDEMPLSSSSASGMGIASTMSTDEITPLGISNIETQESELLASILDMVIDQERRLSLLEEMIANERGDA